MKPLSEKELREKIGRIVFDYPKPDSPNLGDTIDEIMNLILSDRKAWGEHNSKSAEAVNYILVIEEPDGTRSEINVFNGGGYVTQLSIDKKEQN